MGTSTSKEASFSSVKSWKQFSGLSKTSCDAPAAPPPPLPPPGTTTSSPPPPPPAETSNTEQQQPKDAIALAAESVSATIPNPGNYEEAALDCKRLVQLDTHDGFRVDINKQLSPFMAVVHSFWLGTSMLPDGRNRTYTFVTQVADEQGLLMARVDPERGSVDGRMHRALLGGLAMVKVQAGLSASGEHDQLLAELDFGGETWRGNLKYGSMGGGQVFGCNYFQSITERLAMGGEGMYLAANQNILSNYTAKYTAPVVRTEDGDGGGSSTICANFNTSQGLLLLNYKRVVTPNRVTLGAELECSPLSLESRVAVGAEFKLSRSKMALCVDGTGKVQSTLEAKLGMAPGSPSLNFSAELDHAKDQMRFGYGITIDG